MINNVSLTGRLTRDPELKYTNGSNIPVLSFTLAVNRNFKNKQGDVEADFINCVAWNKAAENISNYFQKGSLIGIEGSIQTRTYDDKDGKRVYLTEVYVKSFSFLEAKKNQAPSSGQPGQAAYTLVTDVPF